MRSTRTIRFAAALTLWALPVVAAAQGSSTASISGVVKDASGGVLPGVTVEASSPALIEGSRTVVTDEHGEYKIIELRPGTYSVAFTLEGFKPMKRAGIELPANFTATVNGDLQIGSVQETITVTSAAPLVDVQNVTQQSVISKDMLSELPTGKSMLALMAMMPSVVQPAGSQDVGGSKGEVSVRMSIHGAKQSDQRALQDGMPYNFLTAATGRGFYINALNAQEVVVDTGSGGSAEYSTGGAQVNLIPRDGANTFNGSFFVGGTSHSLQADNLTADLQAQGLKSVNGVRSIYDANFVLGGPLIPNKLWFSTAHRRWGRRERIANLFHDANLADWAFTPDYNQPAEPAEDLRSDNIRLTWQIAPSHKLTISEDWQHNNANNQGNGVSAGTVAMEAIVDPDAYCNRMNFIQSTWTHPSSSRLLFEAGFSALVSYRKTGFDACGGIPTLINVREQSTGLSYHGTGTRLTNYQYPGYQRFSVSYLTGRHQIKTGVNLLESLKYEQYTERPTALPVSYTFNNGSPTQLTEFVTPRIQNAQTFPNLGLFVQDQWRMERITVNLGLRFDYLRSYIPAIDQPGGFPIAQVTHFDEADCLPCWKDINPRVGVSYNLTGDGKTAVKASLGRYVGAMNNALANTYAPWASVVLNTTRSWTDGNRDFVPDCDLKNPAANGECGAMANSVFGQSQVRSSADPNWMQGWGKRDYNWQASVQLDRELRPGVALNVGYFRRWYGNFTVTDNTLVTPADYDPYCITAPSDPRLGSVSGSQICGLYDIKPEKFGQQNNVAKLASLFGRQTEVYNGVDANMVVRLPHRITLSGGWNIGNSFAGTGTAASATFSKSNNCFVVDSPQQLYNCESGNPYQSRVKLNGVMPLRWGIQFAAVYQNLPGAPYGASYAATTAQIQPSLGRPLAGGTRTATIELLPTGSHYLDQRVNQLDTRFSKAITVDGRKFLANVDLYNVLNTSTVLGVNSTFGPSWLVPTQIIDARLIKFSFQVDF